MDDPTDERYLVIDGRRWRRSDPRLPDDARQEMVKRLMDARRAVRAAGSDTVAIAAARAKVHAAKLALGERGPEWWARSSLGSERIAAIRRVLAEWSEHEIDHLLDVVEGTPFPGA